VGMAPSRSTGVGMAPSTHPAPSERSHMPASAAKPRPALADGLLSELFTGRTVRTTIVAAILILLGVGGLLVVRRLAGAFSAELSIPGVLVAALTTTAMAATSRLVWRRCRSAETSLQRTEELFVGWASSAALLLVAVGTSFHSARLSDVLVWMPLLALDQFWRHDFFHAGNTTQADTPATQMAAGGMAGSFTPANVQHDDVVQQMFRVREADGSEAVYAKLLAHFVAGQRHQTVYLGFCPPLDYVPTVATNPTGGPPATLKVAQAFAHGVRIDVKLATAPTAPASVSIDLVARKP
jgi:hypothetical protein